MEAINTASHPAGRYPSPQRRWRFFDNFNDPHVAVRLDGPPKSVEDMRNMLQGNQVVRAEHTSDGYRAGPRCAAADHLCSSVRTPSRRTPAHNVAAGLELE